MVGFENIYNRVLGQKCGTGMGNFARGGEFSRLIRNQL